MDDEQPEEPAGQSTAGAGTEQPVMSSLTPTAPAGVRRLTPVQPGDAVSLSATAADAEDLLPRVARGDADAFEALYDAMSAMVYGVIRRVLRDPAQSEEVLQDVMVEVWRTAPRFDRSRGTARGWVLTMAHRRAVDRVRSEQASRDREDRVGRRETQRPFDEVAAEVEHQVETDQLRAAMSSLTDVQRQAIELAYFGGNTYREVAVLLDTPLGTVKTRMRDGLIRLRDAMGSGEGVAS